MSQNSTQDFLPGTNQQTNNKEVPSYEQLLLMLNSQQIPHSQPVSGYHSTQSTSPGLDTTEASLIVPSTLSSASFPPSFPTYSLPRPPPLPMGTQITTPRRLTDILQTPTPRRQLGTQGLDSSSSGLTPPYSSLQQINNCTDSPFRPTPAANTTNCDSSIEETAMAGLESCELDLPRQWDSADLQIIINLYTSVIPDERRPSKNLDLVELMTDTLKKSKLVRKTRLGIIDRPADLKEINIEAQRIARRFMVRYFVLTTGIDEILQALLPESFETHQPSAYTDLKKRILDTSYTWKNKIINNYIAHTQQHIKETQLLAHTSDATAIRNHYKNAFCLENVTQLYQFDRHINWSKTTEAGQNFLFDVYWLMCVESTLHVQDPFKEGQTRGDLKIFYDSLASHSSPSWDPVTITDFPPSDHRISTKDNTVTSQNVKKRKTITEHPRFTPTSPKDYPFMPTIISNTGNTSV
ncbi:hypothetical protein L873DRAFT_1795311 [Choiromyces venosus 120613-1]|uniref:Uncharacterized protein n=1 Tax=Choiromyces venosus 120613-1 TaxID=1336337 RepID=A0A3N4J0K8_9PEZI|nr:hypothetical protein L873DRAFT_1795311 [Choiromyces venosus 120613-1]